MVKKALVASTRLVGRDQNHLKMLVKSVENGQALEAIGFNLGQFFPRLVAGRPVDLAFQLDVNHWQGESRLQLKLKDIKTHGTAKP